MLKEKFHMLVNSVHLVLFNCLCWQEHLPLKLVLGVSKVVVKGVDIRVEVLGDFFHDIVIGNVR